MKNLSLISIDVETLDCLELIEVNAGGPIFDAMAYIWGTFNGMQDRLAENRLSSAETQALIDEYGLRD